MTKEEAKQLLKNEGYCPTHGCELIEDKDFGRRNPYANAHCEHCEPQRYCPECRAEQSAARSKRIDEAKKVLGL